MKANRFIALEIGENCIRLGVFMRHASGQLELLDHGNTAIELDSGITMAREAVVAKALKCLLDEKKSVPKTAVLSIEGTSVFSRLVKLPPVAPDKVEQTIRHEAVQNIPFPVDEVVWDAHVVDASVAEPEILLVAVKAELIAGLVAAVSANGLLVERVEATPAALANAVRFAYPEASESLLLADIGTHATNLVFVDGARTYFRNLSAGAEAKPKLMQEIERSIAFYRSQQGGNDPQRILLTEQTVDAPALEARLGIPVEMFNFGNTLKRNTGVSGVEGLVALGGLGAASVLALPLSLNLMPASMQAERRLRKRQPVWLACAAVLVMTAAIWIWGLSRLSSLVHEENASVVARISALEEIENTLLPLEKRIGELESDAEVYQHAILQRAFFLKVFEEIRARLPEGMFLLSSESLIEGDAVNGLRLTVFSYLDMEPADQDPVKLLRDSLRESDLFSSETKVFSRPSKGLFARQFMLDVYFEGEVLK